MSAIHQIRASCVDYSVKRTKKETPIYFLSPLLFLVQLRLHSSFQLLRVGDEGSDALMGKKRISYTMSNKHFKTNLTHLLCCTTILVPVMRKSYIMFAAIPVSSHSRKRNSFSCSFPPPNSASLQFLTCSQRSAHCSSQKSLSTAEAGSSFLGRGSVLSASILRKLGGIVILSVPASSLISSSSYPLPVSHHRVKSFKSHHAVGAGVPREGRQEAGMQMVSCPYFLK